MGLTGEMSEQNAANFPMPYLAVNSQAAGAAFGIDRYYSHLGSRESIAEADLVRILCYFLELV